MKDFYLHKNAPERETVLENLIAYLRGLSDRRSWAINVKQHTRDRTDPMNRYLNGCAYKLLSEATGYERDDISEYMCGMHFGWRTKIKPGRVRVEVPMRTTTTDENGRRDVLSIPDFLAYVAFVQRFGAKHGITIPDPDPFWNERDLRPQPPTYDDEDEA